MVAQVSISSSAEVLQKVRAIEEQKRIDISQVQEKLTHDMQELQRNADAKIAAISDAAQKNKKFEVDQAAEVVRSESGEMVQEIQNLAYQQ